VASYANVYGAAINAGAQLGQTAIAGALGGDADSGRGRFDLSSMFDGSGWTVSTGGSRADATATGGGGRTQSETSGTAAGLPGGLGLWAVLAVGLGLALVMRKRGA
jgi:hypothetical protein